MSRTARRIFIAVWILLGLAGALDQTVALDVLGRRIDLVLPNLRYGYVMFNRNPRTVQVYSYLAKDGARHPLSELVPTPALGYSRARMEMNLLGDPDDLAEICYRAARATSSPLIFVVDEYRLDDDTHHPSRTVNLRCDTHGLAPR